MSKKRYRHEGKMLTVAEISERTGEPRGIVSAYIRSGQEVDGRGAGRRYFYKDGLDYSAEKIAEFENTTRQAIDRAMLSREIWPDTPPEVRARIVGPRRTWGYV